MTERMFRLVRAGVLTGVTDGLFASVSALFFGSTLMRLWQGVASTVLGKSAFDGGIPTALLGVLMHFGVAFGWSGVFLFIVMRSSRIHRAVSSPSGVIGIAALYGPFILAGDVADSHSGAIASSTSYNEPLVGPAGWAFSIRGTSHCRIDRQRRDEDRAHLTIAEKSVDGDAGLVVRFCPGRDRTLPQSSTA
ncbi:MAG: hypothetical protein ACR2NS_13080 [Gemmatimonadaceae bacterium]